jgi:hypothetical protein
LCILKHPYPYEVLHMRKGPELLLENSMIPHDPNAPHGEPPEESPQKTDRLKAARSRAGKNGLRLVGGRPQLISRQLSEVAKQSNAKRPELLREGVAPKAMKDGFSLGLLT